MQTEKIRKTCVHFLLAFLGTYGVCYIVNIREDSNFFFSIAALPLAAVIWKGIADCERRLFALADKKNRRKRIRYAALVSAMLGISLVAGSQLQWLGYTEYGFAGKGRILLRGLCVAVPLFPFAEILFGAADRAAEKTSVCRTEGAKPWHRGVVFLCSWLGIWLCWLPVWLAYYPAIMSYDFHRQSLEAYLGPGHFVTHHPVAHTVLIWAFCKLGAVIGSYAVAMGLFSQLQQMILSLVLGYACAVIYRLTGKKWTVLLTVALFGLFPLISVFAVCTTKDVLFSAFFLLFLLLYTERMLQEKKTLHMDVLWVLSGILMILFRNNAWYALAVATVFLVAFLARGERIRMLLLCVLMLAGGLTVRSGIERAVDAQKGGELEAYSVIIQCFARTGNMEEGNMSQETWDLIDTYVTSECWQDYNASIVDSVREYVNQVNRLEKGSWENIGEVVAAWVKVGLQYPNEYLDAFLQLTRGYWYLDDSSHAEMLGVGTNKSMGLLYTYNSYEPAAFDFSFAAASKFPWLKDQLEKLLSANSYSDWPIVCTLFKPAFWCWLLVLISIACLYTRQWDKLSAAVYPLCYFGTMLLGPTALIRYTYPILLAVPLLLALFFHRQGKQDEQVQCKAVGSAAEHAEGEDDRNAF